MNKSLIKTIPLLIAIIISLLLLIIFVISNRPELSPQQSTAIPDFKLTSLYQSDDSTLDSHTLDNTLFIGEWQLLNVWASWCSTCIAEHPFLMELSQQGIPIIGLNHQDLKMDARQFLIQFGNPYQEIIFDPKRELTEKIGVFSTPENFLINPDGVIIYHHSGLLNTKIWRKYFLPHFSSQDQTQE
ncbi:DsbE family thiol:disulfide interchange protein [Vibrio sp. SS-MA-C1-2]|uniref:DsbE family thiol:disulfide interchange protein n=1 Tax=Vibrio sp. SS-MA-C1-2 TaxID=2908646 RepID=UPI001F17F4D8|nr:DsbE family thiol:disulfide interchange protein [Vibrio sp. SS-MA-C1-2]UJF19058.1 DsbE family thiol:disulfide interchange protein [Vibrio sp. SS-MA-C1-2]